MPCWITDTACLLKDLWDRDIPADAAIREQTQESMARTPEVGSLPGTLSDPIGTT